MDGRRLYWPRGRVLGGSSSLNAMVYVRGHALDYDRWVEEGAAGWSYAEVLPYFRRAETFSGGADAYRGGDGPLHVTRGTSANPLFDAWIEAGAQAGYPADRRHERLPAGRHGADGHDHPRRPPLEHGAGLPAPGHGAGPTCSCSPAASPPGSCWSAAGPSGVEYAEGGFVKRALAAREVILAGGAINSPQLLMLSGIGPADQLRRGRRAGGARPARASGATCRTIWSSTSRSSAASRSPCWTPCGRTTWSGSALRWFLFHDGPAASSHLEAGGFIRSRAGRPPSRHPVPFPAGAGRGPRPLEGPDARLPEPCRADAAGEPRLAASCARPTRASTR